MRIEIENNRTLSELVDKVGASGESVELTQHGEVVATVSLTETERKAAAADVRKLSTKARANAKKSHNPTERQIEQYSVALVEEVRHMQKPLSKADRELWSFVDAARSQTSKLGLTDKDVERLADRAVREIRKKNNA